MLAILMMLAGNDTRNPKYGKTILLVRSLLSVMARVVNFAIHLDLPKMRCIVKCKFTICRIYRVRGRELHVPGHDGCESARDRPA